MIIEKGERVRSFETGLCYRVRMRNKEWVLLESENEVRQVLTGTKSFCLGYEIVGKRREIHPLPRPERMVI